jgi:hypothetical protein
MLCNETTAFMLACLWELQPETVKYLLDSDKCDFYDSTIWTIDLNNSNIHNKQIEIIQCKIEILQKQLSIKCLNYIIWKIHFNNLFKYWYNLIFNKKLKSKYIECIIVTIIIQNS